MINITLAQLICAGIAGFLLALGVVVVVVNYFTFQGESLSALLRRLFMRDFNHPSEKINPFLGLWGNFQVEVILKSGRDSVIGLTQSRLSGE